MAAWALIRAPGPTVVRPRAVSAQCHSRPAASEEAEYLVDGVSFQMQSGLLNECATLISKAEQHRTIALKDVIRSQAAAAETAPVREGDGRGSPGYENRGRDQRSARTGIQLIGSPACAVG